MPAAGCEYTRGRDGCALYAYGTGLAIIGSCGTLYVFDEVHTTDTLVDTHVFVPLFALLWYFMKSQAQDGNMSV